MDKTEKREDQSIKVSAPSSWAASDWKAAADDGYYGHFLRQLNGRAGKFLFGRENIWNGRPP